MRPGQGRAPVVVGIGATGPSGDAVEWASAEAAAQGCPLSVVHAYRPPLPTDLCSAVPPIDGLLASRSRAEWVLREAVARARSVHPDGEVSAKLVPGTPAGVLLREAVGARLLVVGRRRPRGLRGLLARPVAVRVSARASCPVVTIPPHRDAGDPGRAPACVVVGIDSTDSDSTDSDSTDSCSSAVGFALRAAGRRGIPLVAVHTWTPDLPADLEAVCGQPIAAETRARRILDRALDRRDVELAAVPVHGALVRGDPARALVAHSRGAALLVVGTRGRGHLRHAVLGSAGRAVLRDGCCPLVVIRHDGVPSARPSAASRRDQDDPWHRASP